MSRPFKREKRAYPGGAGEPVADERRRGSCCSLAAVAPVVVVVLARARGGTPFPLPGDPDPCLEPPVCNSRKRKALEDVALV